MLGFDQSLQGAVEGEDSDEETSPAAGHRIGLEPGASPAWICGEHDVQQPAGGEDPPPGLVLRHSLPQLAHGVLDRADDCVHVDDPHDVRFTQDQGHAGENTHPWLQAL